MKFTQLFSDSDLDKWFDVLEEQAEAAIYEMLKEAGEYFVKLARESGSYQDQTGNLRSSIGYIIVKDGAVLTSSFQQTANGTEGIATGKRIAAAIASGLKGLVLIGVAGMDYAICVEAKGYEVISSSALLTERYLNSSIKKIFK